MYVPILKWRQGEYLALDRLGSSEKSYVMPLVEIPPIEWDFERGCLAKTIDQHLERFAHRFHGKWGNRKAFIDLALLDPAYRMADTTHPVGYIFRGIREHEGTGIPVTGLDRDKSYQEAVKQVVAIDENGLCVRLMFEDIVREDIEVLLDGLCTFHELKHEEIDVVIDLGSPNFNPVEQFAKALHLALAKLNKLTLYRTITIAATSFPKSMGEMKIGNQLIERSEWLLYKAFLTQAKSSDIRPQFGDYAIAHPLIPDQDMRLLKPAASLRYTIDGKWYIGKGTNVRDNGFGQYVDICKSLVNSGYFLGPAFSKGDKYIYDCSKGQVSTGNLTVWRWVGTNHHIAKVVSDLSSLLAI